MINKEWTLKDDSAGIEKLVLVGHNFLEPDYEAKVTVYLRRIFTDANGVERSNVSADYSVEKDKVSYYADGTPLPKRDLQGNTIYQKDENRDDILDEEGNPIPEDRDNGYENIVYYVDNKIMSIYELIDEGVKEMYRLL